MEHGQDKQGDRTNHKGATDISLRLVVIRHSAHRVGENHAADQRDNLLGRGKAPPMIVLHCAHQPVNLRRMENVTDAVAHEQKHHKNDGFDGAGHGNAGDQVQHGEAELVEDM